MFRNTFQSGFLSILYSLGNKPLQLWDKHGTLRAREAAVRACVGALSDGWHGCWLVCAAGVKECMRACAIAIDRSINRTPNHSSLSNQTNTHTGIRAVENGSIKRLADDEVQSGVLEITGTV